MQEWIDTLREKLEVRHQNQAKRHIAKRDYWRRQIYEPWRDMVGNVLVVAFGVGLIIVWLVWG